MRQVWTLIVASAALVAGAAEARAATVDAPRTGAVTGVSVLPSAASGRADVVVTVDSTVAVQDFVLDYAPYRIVLDLTGAKLSVASHFYDKVSRGGIVNVRYAQYKPNVVRLVLELDAPHKYQMTRDAQGVHLSIEATGSAQFAAWHAGDGPMVVAAATPVAALPQVAAAAMPQAVIAPEPVATPAPKTKHLPRIMPADAAAVAYESGTTPPIVTTVGGSVASPSRHDVFTTAWSGATPQHAQQSSQPRITVTYQDSDIREVLAAFASFSGRTIVVGREVQGTVTAEIRDQPWDVALQSILSAQQLAASEDQYGIITVDSYKNIQAKQASEPLVTQMVSINYARASQLIPTVRSLLAQDCGGAAATGVCHARGTVVADSGTNSLLITEAQSHMADVVNYVRDLDIKTPQVSIRAKIIFINRTATTALGIAYDFASPNTFSNILVQHTDPTTGQPYQPTTTPNIITLGGDGVSAIANASRPEQTGSALNLIYSVALGKFSLTSFIDALQSTQLSDVQAEPSIVTLDNRPAKIQVGEEVPIRVLDASAQGAAAVSTVQFKETGIILQVTPHITSNGQVLMTLHAEQSQIQQTGGDLGYYFLKRYSDNQLLVSDGETAVIGGLTQTQVTKQKQGIPVLDELPLIGGLFSATSNIEEKQDLLILVTPHILADTDLPPRVPNAGR
jgi:type IV pilus assembly protein PilQ